MTARIPGVVSSFLDRHGEWRFGLVAGRDREVHAEVAGPRRGKLDHAEIRQQLAMRGTRYAAAGFSASGYAAPGQVLIRYAVTGLSGCGRPCGRGRRPRCWRAPQPQPRRARPVAPARWDRGRQRSPGRTSPKASGQARSRPGRQRSPRSRPRPMLAKPRFQRAGFE